MIPAHQLLCQVQSCSSCVADQGKYKRSEKSSAMQPLISADPLSVIHPNTRVHYDGRKSERTSPYTNKL